MLTVRHLIDGRLTEVPAGRLNDLVGKGEGIVWVDIVGGGPAEVAVLHDLGIDQWVAEDMMQATTHPKAELHPDYLFLVVHAVDLDTED